MNKVILISIGMPVFNGEKFISTAISSLLKQTYSHFELIISDNASTDDTKNICTSFANKDNRIQYFRQNSNRGATENFKFVLDKAKGKYFMWAAADDYWNFNLLIRSLNILEKMENINFIFFSFRLSSINFGIYEKRNINIFKFIKNESRHERMISFLNMHHLSHKCNLVYSLFRIDFIKSAWNIKDISNDGLLSLSILSLGRGEILSDYLFSKRYIYFWPGYIISFFSFFYKFKKNSDNFVSILNDNLTEIKYIFPEYYDSAVNIFFSYREKYFHKNFKIKKI
jgi:glycosyltransferase involved in cell wall biosynthesis